MFRAVQERGKPRGEKVLLVQEYAGTQKQHLGYKTIQLRYVLIFPPILGNLQVGVYRQAVFALVQSVGQGTRNNKNSRDGNINGEAGSCTRNKVAKCNNRSTYMYFLRFT
jgi:hypothetical protein